MKSNFINFYEEYINQLHGYLNKINRKELIKLENFLTNLLMQIVKFS